MVTEHAAIHSGNSRTGVSALIRWLTSLLRDRPQRPRLIPHTVRDLLLTPSILQMSRVAELGHPAWVRSDKNESGSVEGMSLRSGNSSAMTRGDSSKLAIIEDRNPQAYSKERFYQSDQGRPMAPFVSRRPRAGQREGSSSGVRCYLRTAHFHPFAGVLIPAPALALKKCVFDNRTRARSVGSMYLSFILEVAK
jgi:hypothetical protein